MPLFYFDTLFTSARRKTHRFLILYIAENRNSSPKTGIANIKSHFRFALILAEEGRKYVTLDDPGIRDLAVREPALFLQRYSRLSLLTKYSTHPSFCRISKYTLMLTRQKAASGLPARICFPYPKVPVKALRDVLELFTCPGFPIVRFPVTFYRNFQRLQSF